MDSRRVLSRLVAATPRLSRLVVKLPTGKQPVVGSLPRRWFHMDSGGNSLHFLPRLNRRLRLMLLKLPSLERLVMTGTLNLRLHVES